MRRHNASFRYKFGVVSLLIGSMSSIGRVAAGEATGTTSIQNPDWFSSSLSIDESYDGNLYLSNVRGQYPAHSMAGVVALAGVSSFVTTVSPTLAIDLAQRFGTQDGLRVASLAYAPNFAIYHQEAVESNDAHRFPLIVKGQWDPFSLAVDGTLALVDGSRTAPTFPALNAYATTVSRDRRKQMNDQSAASMQYDADRWFVRGAASLLYYDMKTLLLDIKGYQNYVDRYDVNGGADFGYRVEPQFAVTLGYRYGHQYQEQLPFATYTSTTNYYRALLGLDGHPWPWLDVKLQAGPDVRRYEGNAPVNNRHPVFYYGDAMVTAHVAAADTVSFRYKQFQWVSQLGQIPYFDGTYEVTYGHRIDEHAVVDLKASRLSADYTSGNLAISRREDLEYALTSTLRYSFNTHIVANVAYTFDAGRNGLAGFDDPQSRSFNRNLIAVAATVDF